MESTTFKTRRLLGILVLTSIAATLVAWQQTKQDQTPPTTRVHTVADTLPLPQQKKPLKIRNLDDAIENLDQVDLDVNMEKINAELSKIGPEIETALKNANKEVSFAIKAIDLRKINAQIKTSLDQVDWPDIKLQADNSLAKIDMDKIKLQIDKAINIQLDDKKLDLHAIDEALKNIQPDLDKSLKNARESIDKAKKELIEYKRFVDGLENDGLINKKQDYTIINKEGELIINGKKQPATVYGKYRSFLETHKNITIEKSGDDFNIHNDH